MLVKNILVTTDFSEDARRSYACAARIGRRGYGRGRCLG